MEPLVLPLWVNAALLLLILVQLTRIAKGQEYNPRDLAELRGQRRWLLGRIAIWALLVGGLVLIGVVVWRG